MEKKTGKKLYIGKGLRYIVLVLIAFACIFPFYILLINATRAHVEIQRGFSLLPEGSFVKNFKNVWNNESILIVRGMVNSLTISTLTVVLSVYFSTLTAYAIHAYDFKFKKLAFNFILLIMTVPTQVGALGFIKMITAMHMKDTFIPLIIPSIAAPACFFFMKQYMENSLPMEIVEAARIDGSKEFYTFNSIILPLMKPALAVQAIFGFTSSWNNYFTPSLVLTKAENKTLPLWIAFIRGADFTKFDMGQLYMMIAFSIFPVVIMYLFLSKFIVQGVALGGVKG